jgi:uncharacterized protein YdcH (DUF465 family)
MNLPLQDHDIHVEFPEFRERINTLRQQDAHFAKLVTGYGEVNKHIRRVELEAVPALSDEHMESLKKERLHFKDQIHAVLTRHPA